MDSSLPRFRWEAFDTWALVDYGKAEQSLYYYSSRIRAMQRAGLELEACVTDPKALKRQGDAVIANSKLGKRSGHVVRNYQRALNWLSDYGRHLEQLDVRGRLEAAGRHVDDEDLQDQVRRWPRWKLAKEPQASPKSVDAQDLGILWSYTARKDPVGWPRGYVTLLRRCIAELAYVGNFRRGEMPQIRLSGLFPQVGKVHLPRAMKGGLSGDIEVPWSLFWPESALMRFLQVRVDVPGSDQVLTVPAGNGSKTPRALEAAAVYTHLKAMGDELGVPLNFIRTKRRQLSDQDDANVNMRVIKAKGRHVKSQSTEVYLGQVTGSRQRRELAARGMPGYAPQDALRAVDLTGRPIRVDLALQGDAATNSGRCPTCGSTTRFAQQNKQNNKGDDSQQPQQEPLANSRPSLGRIGPDWVDDGRALGNDDLGVRRLDKSRRVASYDEERNAGGEEHGRRNQVVHREAARADQYATDCEDEGDSAEDQQECDPPARHGHGLVARAAGRSSSRRDIAGGAVATVAGAWLDDGLRRIPTRDGPGQDNDRQQGNAKPDVLAVGVHEGRARARHPLGVAAGNHASPTEEASDKPAAASTQSTRLYGAQPLVLQRTAEPVSAGPARAEVALSEAGSDSLPQPMEPTTMPTTYILKKGALQRVTPMTILVPEGPVSAGPLELDGQAADPEVQDPALQAEPTKPASTFTRSKGVAPTGASLPGTVSRYPATRQVAHGTRLAFSRSSKSVRPMKVPDSALVRDNRLEGSA